MNAAEYRAQERLETRLAAIEHRQQALDTAVRQIARILGPKRTVDEINQILSAEKATRPRT